MWRMTWFHLTKITEFLKILNISKYVLINTESIYYKPHIPLTNHKFLINLNICKVMTEKLCWVIFLHKVAGRNPATIFK